MARAACKVIINSGLMALSNSLETILTDPVINGDKIPDVPRYEMIQQLADIDFAAYSGGEVAVSLCDIMIRLEDEFGVLSPDVWKIYSYPESARKRKEGNSKHKHQHQSGEFGLDHMEDTK